MSGGGIGGALGTAAGLALAPETGGLSMAIPALSGAAGAGIGGMIGGDKNPLLDALIGGIGGGVSGGLSGGFDLGDMFGGDAAGAAGAAGDTAASDAGSALTSGIGGAGGDTASQFALPGGAPGLDTSGLDSLAQGAGGATAASPAASGGASGVLGWLGKQNPLQLALAGNTGLSAIQSLMNPLPKYNVAGTANSVMATNPGFNASLPKYSMQNTATPYAGNWYTYGQAPQQSMYNAMPVPVAQAKGGMVGYAHGGRVKGYAMGGNIAPQGMPQPPMAPQNPLQAMPQQAPRPPMAPQAVNPLAIKAAHNIGVAIGQHIRKTRMHTPDGRVAGQGGGQDDIVPAKLSKDEYVLSADIPAALGDGSSEHGGKVLDQFVKNIRQHKASHKGKLPPKAKNPLAYLPKAGS